MTSEAVGGQAIAERALAMADRATHCGMCKIDYLGTGLCPAGLRHGFEAYWPCGRVEILRALASGRLAPNRTLVQIVRSCTGCGACDLQCHFVTGLRPSEVQAALERRVASLDGQALAEPPPPDAVLGELCQVVGPAWASADPVVMAAYTRSILTGESDGPPSDRRCYVAMPRTAAEVAAIVRLARRHDLPFLPRGAGTFLTLALPTMLGKAVGLRGGVIIDLWRMKDLEIDAEARTATIGAGVTAFELQQAAHAHRLRAHVAEAPAHVCTNLASFGIISTWMNRYGWGSDSFVDAELVDGRGEVVRLSDAHPANPYAAARGPTSLTLTPPRIATAMTVKLFERAADETALMLPCRDLDAALGRALGLARRGIGLSLAVLSRRYLADFLSPSRACAQAFARVARDALGLGYAVVVVCGEHDRRAVAAEAGAVLDAALLRDLVLGMPRLAAMEGGWLLRAVAHLPEPLRWLSRGPGRRLLRRCLAPGPQTASAAFDADLAPAFARLYARAELSDPVWLHSFRILPSRMIRQCLFMVRGGFMPADRHGILSLVERLASCADTHQLDHALGFVSFLEQGKLAFVEYDYYYDHTDAAARQRLNEAIAESLAAELAAPGVLPVEYVFNKGLARKEHLFYPLPAGLGPEELARFGQMVQALL